MKKYLVHDWYFPFLVFAGFIAIGCTDTSRASLSAYGEPGIVTCYSGGQTVYTGKSTGRIQSVHQSDGWEFKEAGSGDFIRVSGTCIVRNSQE